MLNEINKSLPIHSLLSSCLTLSLFGEWFGPAHIINRPHVTSVFVNFTEISFGFGSGGLQLQWPSSGDPYTASRRSISHVNKPCIARSTTAHIRALVAYSQHTSTAKDTVMSRHKLSAHHCMCLSSWAAQCYYFFIFLIFLYKNPCDTVFNNFTKLVQQFRKLNSTLRKK